MSQLLPDHLPTLQTPRESLSRASELPNSQESSLPLWEEPVQTAWQGRASWKVKGWWCRHGRGLATAAPSHSNQTRWAEKGSMRLGNWGLQTQTSFHNTVFPNHPVLHITKENHWGFQCLHHWDSQVGPAQKSRALSPSLTVSAFWGFIPCLNETKFQNTKSSILQKWLQKTLNYITTAETPLRLLANGVTHHVLHSHFHFIFSTLQSCFIRLL